MSATRLREEDELARRTVRIHLDLRDVEVLLDQLAVFIEGDIPERRGVLAGIDLLVERDAQVLDRHVGDLALSVEGLQRLNHDLDTGERLRGELWRVALELVGVD